MPAFDNSGYTYVKEDTNLRKIFLFLVVCGFVLIMIIPPLAIPDENTHFLNAYSISRGDVFPDYNEMEERVGKYIPVYIMNFFNEYKDRYAGDLGQKVSFQELYYLSWGEVSIDERNEYFYSSAMLAINPLAYLFSAVGITVGRILLKLFGENYDTAYNLLLISRFSNYIVYCVLGGIAIKRSPCLKRVMALLLFNPTAIFCCVSASHDAIIIPVTMLFAGELCRLIMIEDIMVDKIDIFIVAFCAFFMTAVKIAYAPFLLLLLFVPFSKFITRKRYILSICVVATCCFVGGILPGILRSAHLQGHSVIAYEAIDIQREYLMSNLQFVPSIIWNTIVSYRTFYLSSFIGKLGLLDTNYPIPFLVIFLIGLLLVTIMEALKAGKLSHRFKACNLLLFTISLVGMFMALYISWTPLVEAPMGPTVSGIQGRYFTPMYCFGAMFMISNIHYRFPVKVQSVIDIADEYLFDILVVLQPISVILLVLLRYWM